MKRLKLAIVFVTAYLSSTASLLAVNPDEMLRDPALEARARFISAQLRCLVCRNESIDVSDAELARDLRILVRRRLKAGETDEAVVNYIVSRYGEFVLLKPPFETKTIFLWGAPAVLFLVGCGALLVSVRRRKSKSLGTSLTAEEEARLRSIFNG